MIERIDERGQKGKVLSRGRYTYLEKVIVTEENLRNHMQEMGQISKSKHSVEAEGIRVKLKLSETCLMSVIFHRQES